MDDFRNSESLRISRNIRIHGIWMTCSDRESSDNTSGRTPTIWCWWPSWPHLYTCIHVLQRIPTFMLTLSALRPWGSNPSNTPEWRHALDPIHVCTLQERAESAGKKVQLTTPCSIYSLPKKATHSWDAQGILTSCAMAAAWLQNCLAVWRRMPGHQQPATRWNPVWPEDCPKHRYKWDTKKKQLYPIPLIPVAQIEMLKLDQIRK